MTRRRPAAADTETTAPATLAELQGRLWGRVFLLSVALDEAQELLDDVRDIVQQLEPRANPPAPRAKARRDRQGGKLTA